MTAIVVPHVFGGTIRIPASKSHTIRRLNIATLAEGVSEIIHPLDSLDIRSCVSLCRMLGAEITELRGLDHDSPNLHDEKGEKLLKWIVRGIGKNGQHNREPGRCNVGNSGTTFFLGLAAAALGTVPMEFDGDEQIRKRSAGPLLDALTGLGVTVKSASDCCAPITVQGPWKGGRISLPCQTSQYLSALLLTAPLAPAGVVTEIDVPLLNEKPYIDMTLSYLESMGIQYEASSSYTYFRIPGGSSWESFSAPVPADFSSAAFPAAAAAISGGQVKLLGLDPYDTQGDKAFFGFLEKMGCHVNWEQVPLERVSSEQVLLERASLEQVPLEQVQLGQFVTSGLRAIGQKSIELNMAEWQLKLFRRGALKGGEFDLNDTPDLLPALAAVACYAKGDTALVNAAHVRLKETDRIAVMAEELGKLGVRTTEREDGLIIHSNGGISPAAAVRKQTGFCKDARIYKTDSRLDHRVAMALAAAALGCPSPVEIAGAECAAVTYPGFLELLGADLV